jgi:hypothetical protein
MTGKIGHNLDTRAIEKRLDKGLILESSGSELSPIIKMDFLAIVPR